MDEPIEVKIEYRPDYVDGDALVTPLGDGRYRLELDPMVTLTISLRDRRPRAIGRPLAAQRRQFPRCGDLFEAEEVEPGILRFTRVVERGRLKRFKFCGSNEGPDSPFGRVLARVIELGGRWECVFSSCWTIYLPADCAYDPNASLRELERAPRAGGAAPGDAV